MILNLTTRERLSTPEFRGLHKEISFPAILDDETLNSFGYAILHGTEKPDVNSNQKAIDVGSQCVNGKWFVKWEISEKTLDELIAENTEIAEIKSRLSAIDLDSIAPMRAIMLATGDDSDMRKLTALDDESKKLNKRLKALIGTLKS